MDETTATVGAEPEIETSAIDPAEEALVEALQEDQDVSRETLEDEDQHQEELFTVKVDGVEKQVSRDELVRHYQKEAASNQRFEEAAKIRREAEAQRDNYVQHQQAMADAIARIDQQAQLWAQESQPDWKTLLEENPHEYLKQQELYKARLATLQQAQESKYYLQQQQQQQYQQQLNEHLQNESVKLVNELIPEWKDKSVRERDENELISYLSDIGYSQEDLQALNHSRASNIALARKAMLYDKAMAKINGLKKGNPATAKPVPTVGSKSSAVRKSIDDPDLPFDEFVKLRHEQIKNRR